jgi:hypothetical protein
MNYAKNYGIFGAVGQDEEPPGQGTGVKTCELPQVMVDGHCVDPTVTLPTVSITGTRPGGATTQTTGGSLSKASMVPWLIGGALVVGAVALAAGVFSKPAYKANRGKKRRRAKGRKSWRTQIKANSARSRKRRHGRRHLRSRDSLTTEQKHVLWSKPEAGPRLALAAKRRARRLRRKARRAR